MKLEVLPESKDIFSGTAKVHLWPRNRFEPVFVLLAGRRVDLEHVAQRGHRGEGLLLRHPLGQARRRREEETRLKGEFFSQPNP